MLIPLQDIEIVLKKVINKSIGNSVSVAIWAAQDVDSICSCQILMSLLRSEDIQCTLQVVKGYSDLDQNAKELGDNIKFVFLINCGGLIDLNEIFQQDNIVIYLIDYHRPIHHKNIFSQKKIRFIDDGQAQINSDLKLEDFDHYFEEESESNSEVSDLVSEEVEYDDMEVGQKRKIKMIEEKKIKKKAKLTIKNQINEYYNGNYNGKPSAMTFYQLSLNIGKDNNDFLWLSIVALADLFMQNKISYQTYIKFIVEQQGEVNRLNVSEKQEIGKISNENDFRFMLLRHWNLYDSIYYSNYVSANFGVCWEHGKKKLQYFIAQLGVSLEDSKQLYRVLPTSFKNSLKESICKVAPKFDLNDILISSFSRQIDSKTTVSSSDMVYCLNAILSNQENFEQKNQKFWNAAQLLSDSYNQSDLIKDAIDQAIKFQKNLMQEAQFLIEKKQVIGCLDFRFCFIKQETQIEKEFFTNQLSLQKLALLLMEIFKSIKNEAQAKPMVLALQNQERNIFQIIGVNASYYSGINAHNKNTFGEKFNKIAEKNNIKINQDDFNTAYIEIDKDDYESFVDDLTSGDI